MQIIKRNIISIIMIVYLWRSISASLSTSSIFRSLSLYERFLWLTICTSSDASVPVLDDAEWDRFLNKHVVIFNVYKQVKLNIIQVIIKLCYVYAKSRFYCAVTRNATYHESTIFFIDINMLMFGISQNDRINDELRILRQIANHYRDNDTVSNLTHLDLELRSFGLSAYLLFECFSRDFDRLRECLLLWRRLLGDFDLERERPIFPSLIVFSSDSIVIYEQLRDRFR